MHLQIHEISLAGAEVFEVFGLQITNTFLLSLIISFGFAIFAFVALKPQKILPGKLQNLWEFFLESLYNFFHSITGDKNLTKEIFPLSATIFILIWFCNLIEILPGVGVFHFLRAPSSDLNFTFAIASFSMVYINILVMKRLGFFKYMGKFLNKNPILLFVGGLEAMSELIRILSLGFRLFGNLFAGEVLLIVISALFAYLLPLPFLFLEIIVGFVQAFIFSSLITIFYSSSIQAAHGEH